MRSNPGSAVLPLNSLYRWSGGLRNNTVHVDDVAGAMWACAQWMATRGRAQADSEAGEELHFFNDKARCAEVQCMPAATEVPVAPLFNLVRILCLTMSLGGAKQFFLGRRFGFHATNGWPTHREHV